jgi:hypothetical protein
MSLAKAVPLFLKASGTRSAEGSPYKNALLYPTCKKKIPSKKWFPPSKVTRVLK